MAKRYESPNTDAEFELFALPPFSLERTVAALRRRIANIVEVYEDSEYRRVVTLDGKLCLLAVRQCAPNTVRVRALDGPLSMADQIRVAALLDRMLGLSFDLAPVQRAINGDERLGQVLAQVPGLKPPGYDSLWTTLLCVVPFQQVSLDAGMSILNRLVVATGSAREHAGRAYYAFPSPERIAAADPDLLRQCGLSWIKVRTLMGAAEQIASGALREEEIARLDDEEAVRLLTQLPGIGPWSAQIILLRGFRRLGVFPVGDSGVNGTLVKLFQVDAKQAEVRLRALAESLGPWKGYLYFLLLAWRLLQAGILSPALSSPDAAPDARP
ncbi:MAG TPA: AlkA N-terminal domain-containing protein [Ktedonobacterales bacterium]|nr:AlkA N-terminal domain-containing protein [Ktedonobacterales bacterium]